MYKLLGAHCGIPAEHISITHDEKGKPSIVFLSNSINPPNISISYANDLVVCAVGEAALLGIDIEMIPDSINYEEIANRFFSVSEQKFLLHHSNQPINDFHRIWVRKEAVSKAIGTGMSFVLSKTSMLDDSGESFASTVNTSCGNSVHITEFWLGIRTVGAIASSKPNDLQTSYLI